tara:strand:+ start:3699 stop:4190 length:492 start_codon:yes stop_codon:yes gene_type:complete
MPLVVATLQAELIGELEKGPAGNASPVLVGLGISKAFNNFCLMGMNAGAGNATGMPGISALGSDLGEILSGISPSSALTATKMAKAFDTCMQTFLSLFQTTIVTAPALPLLQLGLTQLLSTPNPSATMFAQGLAKELHTYVGTCIVSGVIPGTPPVPFTGPLS